MAVCIFLFCTLQTIAARDQRPARQRQRVAPGHAPRGEPRLPAAALLRRAHPGDPGRQERREHRTGSAAPCRRRRKARPRRRPRPPRLEHFFPNMAVDAETYFAMYPEYQIPPGSSTGDFLRRPAGLRRSAASSPTSSAGRSATTSSSRASSRPIARRRGPSSSWCGHLRQSTSASTRAPTRPSCSSTTSTSYEATGRTLSAGTYTVAIDDPNKAGSISKAIDAQFENSDAQTHTETEQAFRAGFIAMAGNLALLLNSIGLAVTLHDPAGHREHDEHGRARAAHRDRGAQDAGLLAAAS